MAQPMAESDKTIVSAKWQSSMNTDKQVLLETQHGKPVKAILEETLAKFAGRKSMAALVGIELGVTGATIYNWCDQLGIDIAGYRRPVDAEHEAE